MELLKITFVIQSVVGGFLFLLMYSEYSGKPFDWKKALTHQFILFIVLIVIGLFSMNDNSNVEWVETPHGGQWVEMR